MTDRRRKKRKKKNKFAKMMKSLSKLKIRIPIPPIGSAFKSKKDYDRKKVKKMTKQEFDDYES